MIYSNHVLTHPLAGCTCSYCNRAGAKSARNDPWNQIIRTTYGGANLTVSDRIGKGTVSASEVKESGESSNHQTTSIGGTEAVSAQEEKDRLLASAADYVTVSDPYIPFAGVEVEWAEEEPKKKSIALVRPEDITDAVDSTDLLDTLLTFNLEKIVDKNDQRVREKWASQERDKIRAEYEVRARKAYEKMWDTCYSSKVGHSWLNLDSAGYTLSSCQVCSYTYAAAPDATPNPFTKGTYDHNNFEEKRKRKNAQGDIAREMNAALITAMKDRMIEVDEEAGILIWPTADDYTGEELVEIPSPDVVSREANRVKRWFGGNDEAA